MIKAAVLLTAYALFMIAIGAVTYLVAPPGANAATALIIPAACGIVILACAALCVVGRSPNPDGTKNLLGMIGVHAGLVLPLVFAIAIAGRAVPGTRGVLESIHAIEDADATTPPSPELTLEDAPSALEATATGAPFLESAAAKNYQVVGLWSLTAMSTFAFLALVLLRPKPAKALEPSTADGA